MKAMMGAPDSVEYDRKGFAGHLAHSFGTSFPLFLNDMDFGNKQIATRKRPIKITSQYPRDTCI